MKVRKKPVVVDAVQLRWDTWSEMCHHADVGKLADGKPEGCYVGEDGLALAHGLTSNRIGLHISTKEGLMLGVQDDWIIRGVKGELYPCKPDVFEATYEGVEKFDALLKAIEATIDDHEEGNCQDGAAVALKQAYDQWRS